MGLYDAILIKENHIALAGGLGEAVARGARGRSPEREVEVECRDARRGRARRSTPAPTGCCSTTWTPTALRAAVAARDDAARRAARATLEASGGVTLDNVAEIAATGVDFISVGALTHSAPALDLSMLLEPA